MQNEKTPDDAKSGLVRLEGTIRNYKVRRAEASFVFTDGDSNTMGAVAIAAAAAGLSGPAVATAANAGSTEEDADYLEFDLNGESIKGWVWRSPFKEGDHVEVAAEMRGNHYEAAGIARPLDRVIALYPHCSRGRARHIWNAVWMWLIGVAAMLAYGVSALTVMSASGEIGGEVLSLVCGLAYGLLCPLIWFLYGTRIVLLLVLSIVALGALRLGIEEIVSKLMGGGLWAVLGTYIFFGLMTISLTRQWMPFVRLAEKVFRTLGWPRPGYVDLVRSSNAKCKPDDPDEMGTFYFRY